MQRPKRRSTSHLHGSRHRCSDGCGSRAAGALPLGACVLGSTKPRNRRKPRRRPCLCEFSVRMASPLHMACSHPTRSPAMKSLEAIEPEQLATVGGGVNMPSSAQWIMQHESGGNTHAQNPTSTAYGAFQMLKATRKQYM